jgi:protein-tyrosine-phosphatase
MARWISGVRLFEDKAKHMRLVSVVLSERTTGPHSNEASTLTRLPGAKRPGNLGFWAPVAQWIEQRKAGPGERVRTNLTSIGRSQRLDDRRESSVNVLFVCVGNQGRSVMAERLFSQAVDGRHEARSAGSNPGESAHPVVLEALEEIGIHASDHVPAKLDDERVQWADIIVATCDDACPVIPGKRYINWHLPDAEGAPARRSSQASRRRRDTDR